MIGWASQTASELKANLQTKSEIKFYHRDDFYFRHIENLTELLIEIEMRVQVTK